MRRQELEGRANAATDSQQPLATVEQMDANCTPHNDQVDVVDTQVTRSEETSAQLAQGKDQQLPKRIDEDRNWSARIRASITRLMEVGISLDHENPAQLAEKRKAREAEKAFHERVAQLEEATQTAHKEYSERLRSVYSASTAKKMRLTSKKSAVKTGETSESRQSNEALETLVVAAASKRIDESGVSTSKVQKTKRFSRQDGTGMERSPTQVHDPTLAKAVDNLADKLTQLLSQLQATSDRAAAEPILAAAATIALEATEMRRSRDVAMARLAEIEEHRQQIMKGLLEYEKRKEEREMNEESKEGASSTSEPRDNSLPLQDSDSKVDGKST